MNIYVNKMKKWKQKWKRLKTSKQKGVRNVTNHENKDGI